MRAKHDTKWPAGWSVWDQPKVFHSVRTFVQQLHEFPRNIHERTAANSRDTVTRIPITERETLEFSGGRSVRIGVVAMNHHVVTHSGTKPVLIALTKELRFDSRCRRKQATSLQGRPKQDRRRARRIPKGMKHGGRVLRTFRSRSSNRREAGWSQACPSARRFCPLRCDRGRRCRWAHRRR
jgi:hypothetical protein